MSSICGRGLLIQSPQNLGLILVGLFVLRDGVEDLTFKVEGFELHDFGECLQRLCLGIEVEA